MNANWTGLAALVILAGLGLFPPAHALDVANRWASAKNRADDRIYFDHRITLYCRCQDVSDEDSDGSGTVDMGACGVTPLPEKKNTTKKIQWEHIVPAWGSGWAGGCTRSSISASSTDFATGCSS